MLHTVVRFGVAEAAGAPLLHSSSFIFVCHFGPDFVSLEKPQGFDILKSLSPPTARYFSALAVLGMSLDPEGIKSQRALSFPFSGLTERSWA